MQNKQNTLEKRARSKYISHKLAYWLLNGNPGSPLTKDYRDSLYCCHVLRVDDDRITGKYCKHRWCLTCNRIRMAVLMLGYGPQLKAVGDMYFVTLTARSVERAALPARIAFFEKTWGQILAVNRQQSKRGHGRVFVGLRKAECNPRPNNHYHYHFHVMVHSKLAAYWLVNQWLTRMGDLAEKKAQDIRKADDRSLLEVFKYQVKLPTKHKNGDYSAGPGQLDWIFQCLRGKRTLQPFGGLKMISEELDDNFVAQGVPEGLEGIIWQWQEHDWLSELGEWLTKWVPTQQEIDYIKEPVPT